MLKNKLQQGECLIGTWCEIPSPAVSNVIAKAGMDFIIIDMEHGPIDFKVAQEMSMAAEADNCQAIVRVSGKDESSILRALDIGAAGIIVPHIKNEEEADMAVKFSKFKPVGGRSYNPYVRAMGYNSKSDIGQNNQNAFLAIMLEDINSLKNLESIISHPAIDLVYLGVYDLAVSMGYGNDIKNENVQKVLSDAIKRIIEKGKAVGCMVHNQEEIDYYKKLGVSFLVYKVDTSVIYDSYKKISK
ncbi:MAG: hypothetical protein COT92_03880 [Candidatus Doudnabacteria bacterium CG10_big_fil_rev_8_21_14_0_10_42_18]|uniref:HpcH/HpaI aldolase/citrate lyase domain-containing protein n=1 Tax=Candidatus Doudnabacteria bacterium CG10_big_fil_rev_8_21_14_0_10_42_18 TaxID=1974552 RepID=A0A2H0VC68_9BACT|nr:MAG: hypothetical protein COT92_03880 [Candidatus Doudnabacteria bacterium CG10_big_fil_rev_8_21_14_0_10_42_18]